MYNLFSEILSRVLVFFNIKRKSMNLESNSNQNEFEVFDRILTGHFVNLKLIKLTGSVLETEVVLEVLSRRLEANNQIMHEEELNKIEPVRKKLRNSNKLNHFILYKVKETEPTRHEVNNLLIFFKFV